MPKEIDDQQACAVRLVSEHVDEYPSLTAAAAAVARQFVVGKESVRRWVVQAQVDDRGHRAGSPTPRLTSSTNWPCPHSLGSPTCGNNPAWRENFPVPVDRYQGGGESANAGRQGARAPPLRQEGRRATLTR